MLECILEERKGNRGKSYDFSFSKWILNFEQNTKCLFRKRKKYKIGKNHENGMAGWLQKRQQSLEAVFAIAFGKKINYLKLDIYGYGYLSL